MFYLLIDGENNAPGHWKICEASSGKSTCQKCKVLIKAGQLRVAEQHANAISVHQEGRSMAAFNHLKCYFDWLGNRRPSKPAKGLAALNNEQLCAERQQRQ